MAQEQFAEFLEQQSADATRTLDSARGVEALLRAANASLGAVAEGAAIPSSSHHAHQHQQRAGSTAQHAQQAAPPGAAQQRPAENGKAGLQPRPASKRKVEAVVADAALGGTGSGPVWGWTPIHVEPVTK